MQVKKLQTYIDKYKRFLLKDRSYREIFLWESLHNFQQAWEPADPKLHEMYDRALQNSQTQRLWKEDAWYPKEMMKRFAEIDPDFVRTIFLDLFDESQPIVGRISRFKYFCDDLLQQYKSKHKLTTENNHYHDDNRMIFTYLCFRYPDNYSLYHYEAFRNTMELLESRNIPSPYELERFVKITKAIYNFFQKDHELMDMHKQRLNPKIHYTNNTQLLVYDFYLKFGSPNDR